MGRSGAGFGQPRSQRREVEHAGADAGELPVDDGDPVAGDQHVRRVQLPVYERGRNPCEPVDDRFVAEDVDARPPRPELEEVPVVPDQRGGTCDPREPVMQPREPPSRRFPAVGLELVELGSRHLLDDEPVPPAIGIDDGARERRRAETRFVEQRAVHLDLATRVVQEVQLRCACPVARGLRREILEQQFSPSGLELDERSTGAILERTAASRRRAEQLGELGIGRVVDRAM